MGQGVDVQFISHMHQPEPQPKAGKRSSWKPRAIHGNSWFLPEFHKGAVASSHVDDNLIVINSHTIQLEPQQV